MIVEHHGSELINVLVGVYLVDDRVVSLAPVPLVEEHLEEDGRVLVPIDNQFHLLPLDKVHLLLV